MRAEAMTTVWTCPEGSYPAAINRQGEPDHCLSLSTGQEVARIPNRHSDFSELVVFGVVLLAIVVTCVSLSMIARDAYSTFWKRTKHGR